MVLTSGFWGVAPYTLVRSSQRLQRNMLPLHIRITADVVSSLPTKLYGVILKRVIILIFASLTAVTMKNAVF
jgi:hypothetical protein